jgi:stage II sporulation protein GA (sporulation sigma-E factor processing peptidase)
MYSCACGKEQCKREKVGLLFLIFIAMCMEGSIRWTGTFHGVWIVPLICRLIGRERQRKEQEMEVILSFKGREKRLMGFYDSGNRLAEPLTGKMVHIANYEDVAELLPECYRQEAEAYFETGILNSTKVTELQMYEFTFLSYHSIGNENGQLLGIRMDSADFISKAGKKTEEKVVIGLTKQRLFVRGQDRMIVNGRLEI